MNNRKNIKYSINYIIIIITGFLLFVLSCIDPFHPEIKGESDLLVVDGSIIKGKEKQIVKISMTSSIGEPEYLPVENCNVSVVDNSGNEFFFNEEEKGEYISYIDDAFLNYNSQYKLIFYTPSGDQYESDYQTLLETPPVDSFYYNHEYEYSYETNSESIEGYQFYIDINAPENASRFYRWKLTETWEIRAISKIRGVYDGEDVQLYLPYSDSLFYCWDTRNINGLYSTNTVDLSENIKKEIPLYFIENTSKKLGIKYCATVEQYALNEDAYKYWQQKEAEINESGNVYTRQPSMAISNIYNVNNEKEQVLGFFWASSCSIDRIFLKSLYAKDYEISCFGFGIFYEYSNENDLKEYFLENLESILNTYRRSDLARTQPLPSYPYYIIENRLHYFALIIHEECVDCRKSGGVIQKPDFWE